jgi:hypothetical protein
MPPTTNFLFTNAKVFTADPNQPHAQAVAIRNNRIVFVGTDSESASWRAPDTRVIDCGGRTLLPGFIDSHFHLLMGSLKLDGIQFEGLRDHDLVRQRIVDFAAQHPDRPWLDGYGLFYNVGPHGVPLNRHHLDAIVADRPLVVHAYDYHTAWANTLALKTAGIFNGGEVGPNSEIVLDEHGEATGELREGAQEPIRKLLPEASDSDKRALLNKGMQIASRFGVTSVHNMDDSQNEFYAAAEDNDELNVRVYLPYSIRPTTSVEQLRQEAPALREKYQSDLLRGGSVKLFIDGVIESYTGLLVEEYADAPGVFGEANYEIEHFNQLVVESDRMGFQVKVHATGDMGVRRVLDAYELAQKTNGKRDSRHRVEHIEVIHPTDIHRFKELDVIASMQPLHSPIQANDADVWVTRVGPQRWPLSFAWQTLREAGARLAFGSDWPVVTQDTMLGVHVAVNRVWPVGLPPQKQTLENTLIAYTRDAAYTEFQEHQKGQLKVGYLADIVLLAEDIFNIPTDKLAEAQPVLTMCDGRIVYEA